MRCEHDTLTAELPGLPELPPKEPRTTQAERMSALMYQGPKERDRCETCRNCDIEFRNPDSLAQIEVRRCNHGKFPVLRGGICNDWAAA